MLIDVAHLSLPSELATSLPYVQYNTPVVCLCSSQVFYQRRRKAITPHLPPPPPLHLNQKPGGEPSQPSLNPSTLTTTTTTLTVVEL